MILLLESFNNEGLLAQPLVVLSSKNESWGPKFWPVARLRDRLECKHMLSYQSCLIKFRSKYNSRKENSFQKAIPMFFLFWCGWNYAIFLGKIF